MIVEVKVLINGSKDVVWSVISDIEGASETINGIEKIEVLEKPKNGLVGLKWRETRTIFGKTATEVMWITDASENKFYKTRAESHGSIYISTLSISEQNGSTSLTMAFESIPQSFVAKLLSIPMGFVFKGATRKAIVQDLDDIKLAVEQQRGKLLA